MSLILILTVITLVCVAIDTRFRSRVPVPPGPKGLPFIGNLHQFPRKDPFKTYYEWSKIYGPLVYFHIFGREFVVLNTLKAATDLFEKRSAIYSTKPRLVMAGELVGREQTSVLFTKYGPRLKQIRQILHSWINKKAVEKYWPLQNHGSLRLLGGLLDSPDLFAEHIRHTAGSVILQLTYGIHCAPHNDPWIHMSEELSKITAAATQPGKWLVDSFPILRFVPTWLPGAHFMRWAMASRKHSMELVRIPYNMVKDNVLSGCAPYSWTSETVQAKGAASISSTDESIITCAAGSIYAGGIDTTVSAVRTFFLMMARHPEYQRRAQEELDAVIGIERLPTMEDRDSLPFIGSLIKEIIRINVVAPVVPHSLDTDDVYEGYRIPKGTWVMVNLWAILHDPETYKDPECFNPDRFNPELGDDAEMDPTHLAFGIGLGRRFCPGYHLAQSTIFLNVTQVLSAFNISPPLDSSGKEVPPPPEYNVGHLSAPAPFQCTIRPRSPEKAALVRQSLAAADPEFGSD